MHLKRATRLSELIFATTGTLRPMLGQPRLKIWVSARGLSLPMGVDHGHRHVARHSGAAPPGRGLRASRLAWTMIAAMAMAMAASPDLALSVRSRGLSDASALAGIGPADGLGAGIGLEACARPIPSRRVAPNQ
jgi:hypothetical protein